MIFAFGNPTRSQGVPPQIAEWVTDYGEDSDFVRVRVRGLPPVASDLHFIDSTRVPLFYSQ